MNEGVEKLHSGVKTLVRSHSIKASVLRERCRSHCAWHGMAKDAAKWHLQCHI